ncbi:MAG: hypothetical protein R3B13_16455 [Polyangiaceae bacterium]
MADSESPIDPSRAAGPMYPRRVDALRDALSHCNQLDSEAILWRYTVTHGQLALRVEGPAGVRAVLWLDGCSRIEAPARWTPVALTFRQVSTGVYELADESSAFRVLCGLILVGEDSGPLPEGDVELERG